MYLHLYSLINSLMTLNFMLLLVIDLHGYQFPYSKKIIPYMVDTLGFLHVNVYFYINTYKYYNLYFFTSVLSTTTTTSTTTITTNTRRLQRLFPLFLFLPTSFLMLTGISGGLCSDVNDN